MVTEYIGLTSSQLRLVESINKGDIDAFNQQLQDEENLDFIFHEKAPNYEESYLNLSKLYDLNSCKGFIKKTDRGLLEVYELKAEIEAPVITSHTLLSWAIKQAQPVIVAALIENERFHLPINLNITGRTPLIQCLHTLNLELEPKMFASLLAAGADPTAVVLNNYSQKVSLLAYIFHHGRFKQEVLEILIFSGYAISDDKEKANILERFTRKYASASLEKIGSALLTLSSALYHLKAGDKTAFIQQLNESYTSSPELINDYIEYLIDNVHYHEAEVKPIDYNPADYCYNHLNNEHLDMLWQGILGLLLAKKFHSDENKLALFAKVTGYLYGQLYNNPERMKLAANFAQFADGDDSEKMFVSCFRLLNNQTDEIGEYLITAYDTNKQQLLEFIAERQLDAIRLRHQNELDQPANGEELFIFAVTLLEKKFLAFAHALEPVMMVKLAQYLKDIGCPDNALRCFDAANLTGLSPQAKQLYIELFQTVHGQLPAMGEITKHQIGNAELWLKTKFNSQEEPVKKTLYLSPSQPQAFTETIKEVAEYANYYRKNGFYRKLSFKGEHINKADELLDTLNNSIKASSL